MTVHENRRISSRISEDKLNILTQKPALACDCAFRAIQACREEPLPMLEKRPAKSAMSQYIGRSRKQVIQERERAKSVCQKNFLMGLSRFRVCTRKLSRCLQLTKEPARKCQGPRLWTWKHNVSVSQDTRKSQCTIEWPRIKEQQSFVSASLEPSSPCVYHRVIIGLGKN